MARDRLPVVRTIGSPIKAIDLYEQGTACHAVPVSFVPILIGLVQDLLAPEAWKGEVSDRALAMAQVMHFVGTFGTDETLCTDEIIVNGEAEPPSIGGGFELLECEGCEMANCSIPYGALRWNNGILEYLYCGNWYPVDGVAPEVNPPPDDEIIPDPPPTGYVDSEACAQATALAVMTYNIVVQAFAQYDPDKGLWEYYNDLSEQFARIDLAFNDVANIFFQLIPVNIAGLEGETKDIGLVDYLKCAFVDLIPGNNGGITADEYEALRGVVKETIKVGLGNDYLGFNKAMSEIWSRAFWAIGAGDAAKITYFAQPDAGDDCSCEGLGPIEASSIFFNGSFDVPAPGTCALETYEVIDGGRRVRLQLAGSAGNYRNMTDIRAHVSGAEVGDNVTFRLYNDPTVADYMPAHEWFGYSTPAPPTDWVYMECVGGNPTTRQVFSNYVEWTSDDDVAAQPTKAELVDCRFYPDNPGLPGGWRTRFFIEIVAVNGVRLAPIGP